MPNLHSFTCILNIPYVRRPKAIDPFYGPDGVELCLDILGPCPLPAVPTPTVIRIDGCPGWGPGWRNAGIGPSSNPILARAGYLTVSVSVRHTRQAHYPAQLDDTNAAIDWLHANPLNLPIDTNRIGIWGQSAGGHLAALAAVTGASVQAAATLCGPSDFLSPEWPRDPDTIANELFGADPEDCRAQMRHASPVTHVSADTPPLLIIHGTLDETVPFRQAERLHSAIQRAGGNSRLVPIPNAYHNLRSDPRPAGEIPVPQEVGHAVREFFDEHLKTTRDLS